MSLRLRLLSLLLLAVLPLAGLMMYTYVEQRRDAVREAQQRALGQARLAATEQQRIIDSTRQLLGALAQLPCVRDQEGAACSLLFANELARSSLYQNLTAATADGDLFCSAVPLAAKVNVADRLAFQRALQTRDFSAGEFTISRTTRRPSITFVYPVLDASGEVRGTVGAAINLGWLGEFMTSADLPAGSTLSVLDQSGAVMARYPDPEQWVGARLSPSAMQAMVGGEEGVTVAAGIDATPRLYAFARLCCTEGSALYVRVGIPEGAAFAQANRALARNAAMLGVATLLALALAWGGGQRLILTPVRALLEAIKRLEAGDLTARVGPAAGGGELGRVAGALDEMAAAVEAREAERSRSEQELRRYSGRVEALRSIAARLNTHLDLGRVLDAVCEETTRALEVPAAGVSLYDAGQEALHLAASLGLPEELHQRIHALSPMILAALRREQVGQVADIAAHPGLPEANLLAALGIRSVVGAPMLHDGQLVGALFILTRGRVRHFNDDEVSFLRAIADQAASAVANARLYESRKREQRLRGELLRHLILAQEEERKRIARDLHDETSQGLSVLVLSLETVGMELARAGGQASRSLQMARATAQSMLEGIRRLIGDLRPALLDDLGLVPAIAWYAEQRLETLGVEVDLECDLPDESRLPPAIETGLFRIAQEAISNVAQHSGASKVSISLRIAGERAILVVEDNGRGFEAVADPAHEPTGRGFGLQSVRERVRILGGELTLHTAPGQGARLEVNVPFTPEEAVDGQDPGAPG